MSTTAVNVLVIFYSCSGETEKLALAAAVGAVQARANIRMRRLTDAGEKAAGSQDALTRMRREYVPPTPADALWADAVLIGMNRTVAGVVRNPGEATTFGRQAAMATREIKNTSQPG